MECSYDFINSELFNSNFIHFNSNIVNVNILHWRSEITYFFFFLFGVQWSLGISYHFTTFVIIKDTYTSFRKAKIKIREKHKHAVFVIIFCMTNRSFLFFRKFNFLFAQVIVISKRMAEFVLNNNSLMTISHLPPFWKKTSFDMRQT